MKINEDKIIEDCLRRLIVHEETQADLDYLKLVKPSKIIEISRALQGENSASSGNWNPDDGRTKNGKFYGRD